MLSRSLEWRIQTTKREIYLTFDDGPVPGPTEFVLNQLDKYKATATFFCVGENVEKHPELFKNVVDAGHDVGNHTFSHLKAWSTTQKAYLNNIQQCHVALAAAYSDCTKPLFRPPHGQLSPWLINKLKSSHRIIMWDLLSYDFDRGHNGDQSLQRLIRSIRAGSIVVFHDSYKAEEKLNFMLPKVLQYCGEAGYVFKKLSLSEGDS